MYFQDLVLALQNYWSNKGCTLTWPYDLEKGAATFNPATFLRALGPEPFNAAYIEPCRRPADGRYGENPIRMQHYYQFQVVLKPNPLNMMELYIDSLAAIGIHALEHDIRFVHDDWESPTLGAWGLGWEVWVDGMEVTQYTYFQQVGGIELAPVMGEITYGLERLCMFLQDVDNVYDIVYNSTLKYGDLFRQNEIEFSKHNFELADVNLHHELFNRYEAECIRLREAESPASALDYCLKASHSFNLLDARGAISVSERQGYILRVRKLARTVAEGWLKSREKLDFPLTSTRSPDVNSELSVNTVLLDSANIRKLVDKFDSSVTANTLPLLVELGVEEIPAKVFGPLLDDLPERIERLFEGLSLRVKDTHIFTTPRRLCIAINSVQTRQKDQAMSIKGPPLRIAKDSAGQWTKAALGFASKNGVEADDLEIRRINDVDYLFVSVTQKGRTAFELLIEAIPNFFGSIPWYKAMCWSNERVRFVRPVRWLTAMFGEWIIPTEFAGVPSGGRSFGHRFLAPSPIELSADIDRYLRALEEAFVVADHHNRKSRIRHQIKRLAEEARLTWKEDAELVEEVTHLVEYPVAILCSFEEKYLDLPEIVLISEMKHHQKYFPLFSPNGTLSNYFVVISNMECKNTDTSRYGYERVLRSRFADAEFFLAEDLKLSLEERVPKLSHAIFQSRLGTILEKVERMKALAGFIASTLSIADEGIDTVQNIAHLCKSDLNSSMVGEFPELQGEVGYHYAIKQGLPKTTANGIREHYLPKNITDEYPTMPEAAIVGIADRIDTLVGVFGIGKAPTGTADPYGLRRACLTCIAIIVHMKFKVNLRDIIRKSIDTYSALLDAVDKERLERQVLDFFATRITGLLQDGKLPCLAASYPLDLVKSVVNASPSWYDLTDLLSRLEAMDQFRQRSDFVNISATFKRVNNILREHIVDGDVDRLQLKENEEKTLWETFLSLDSTAKGLIRDGDYTTALKTLAQLREPVDEFFDAVLVNDPDDKIRDNRKCLLHKIRSTLLHIADFSQLQGD